MKNLKDLTLEEMEAFLESLGEAPYRGRQIMEWIFRGVDSFQAMTNLSLRLRKRLEQVAVVPSLVLKEEWQSHDGKTRKFLFLLPDGEGIESVLMKFPFRRYEPPGEERLSLCLSTQVGCALACVFCASGLSGMKRNLEAWEILDQVIQVQRITHRRIQNVVLMGMGEPLANYQRTMKAIRLLTGRLSPEEAQTPEEGPAIKTASSPPPGIGLGARHVTISTAGLVPGIVRLSEEGLPVKLAVSLHAPDDPLRSRLMPINRKYPLSELLLACKAYQEKTKGRVTFEYLLIAGLNDAPSHARKLLKLLRGINCLLNLIPLNPVPDLPYLPSPPSAVKSFKAILEGGGIKVTVREEKGRDIQAACGQLRRKSRLELSAQPRP